VHAAWLAKFWQEYVWHVEVVVFHVHPAAALHAAFPATGPAAVYEEHAAGSQAESVELHAHAPVHAAEVVIVEHEAAQIELDAFHAHPGCAAQVACDVFDPHARGFHVVLDSAGTPPGVP
jgi:hypothetical protein